MDQKFLVNALDNRVSVLEEQLRTEQRKNRILQLQLTTSTQKLKKFFNSDQLDIIGGKKQVKWTDSTIKKALLIKSKGGDQLLNYARKNIAPLPCSSVINAHIKSMKIKPEVLQMDETNLD